MNKLLLILQNVIILILITMFVLILSLFIIKIKNQKLDTSYMWNIKYSNLNVTDGSKEADLVLDDNELALELTLENELEFYELTIDIENSGTLDAKISEINLNIENDKNIIKSYLTYDDNTEIKIGDEIKSNGKKTIKLRIEYPKQEEKIYESLTLKLSLNIKLSSN